MVVTPSSVFGQITMESFIGTNLRRADPVERLDAVGFVREYHTWAVAEDNSFGNVYPSNKIKWNPTGIGEQERSFDAFYQKINDAGVTGMVATIQGSVPYLDQFSTTFCADNESKPIIPNNGNLEPLTPESYRWHSDFLTLYAARYGTQNYGGIPSSTWNSKLGAGNLYGDFTPGAFIGNLYIENWNEQDKFWCGIDELFTAEEYATMSSMDYDGNMNTDFEPSYGMNKFGTSSHGAKLVFGGLYDIDAQAQNYVTDTYDALENIRGTNNTDIFDVLNFHFYTYSNEGKINSYGLTPEEFEDGLGITATLSTLKTNLSTYNNGMLANKEYWISEFGYDSNPFSDIAAIPDYDFTLEDGTVLNLREQENIDHEYEFASLCANGLTIENEPTLSIRKDWEEFTEGDKRKIVDVIEDTQGRWIVRTYLAIKGAGFDRAMQFCIRDVQTITEQFPKICYDGNDFVPSTSTQVEFRPDAYRFESSGLVRDGNNGHQPKAAYYYTKTMKEVLTGTDFVGEVANNSGIKIYQFSDGLQDIYAIWNPTPNFDETIDVPIANFITDFSPTWAITTMEVPYDRGKTTQVGASMIGSLLSVSDKPMFLTADSFTGFGDLVTNCSLQKVYQTCSHVRINPTFTDFNTGQEIEFDKYIVYYANTADVNDPDNPLLSELTLYDDNISGNINEIVVTDYQKGIKNNVCRDAYYIYVRGVINEGNYDRISDYCRVYVSDRSCTCTVDIDINGIEGFLGGVANNDETESGKILFDYSDVALCNLQPNDIDHVWIDEFYTNQVGGLIVPFLNPQPIDAMFIFDGTDNDIIKFFFDTGDGTFPTSRSIEYDTRLLNDWVSFANLPFLFDGNGQPLDVHRVRIERSPYLNKARIGKVFFVCHDGEVIEKSENQLSEKEVKQLRSGEIIDPKVQVLSDHNVRIIWDNPYNNVEESLRPREIQYTLTYSLEGKNSNEGDSPTLSDENRGNSKQLVFTKNIRDKEHSIEIVDERVGDIKSTDFTLRLKCPCAKPQNQTPSNGRLRNKPEVHLYPNPVKDILYFETTGERFSDFQIIDVVGKNWMKGDVDNIINETKIDVSKLPPGIYFLQLEGAGTKWKTFKFVVSE